MPLTRAYCLPGEYCIFYRHFPQLTDKLTIANEAVKHLMYALAALHKNPSPLFDLLNAGQYSVNLGRIKTATPRKAGQPFLSLVILEIPPPLPQKYPNWEAVYRMMYNSEADPADIQEATELYADGRVTVMNTIAAMYKPLVDLAGEPVSYLEPQPRSFVPGANRRYFAAQDVLNKTLNGAGILAVAPHWLVVPSPNAPPPADSGGPGARPIDYAPESEPSLRFDSSDGRGRWWEAGDPSCPVHVVVFDSVHNINRIVQGTWNQWNVPLLRNLVGVQPLVPVTTAQVADIDIRVGDVWRTDIFHIVYDNAQWNVLPATNPAGYPNCYPQGHDYKMPDHGLFVSGIIRSIEPEANIYLVEVLNEYGIGNVETVWCGLLRFWNYLQILRDEGKIKDEYEEMRLVFNCSLGFDTPSGLDLANLESYAAGLDPADPVYQRYERSYIKLGLDIEDDLLYQSVHAADPRIGPHEFVALVWPTYAGVHELFSSNYFDIARSDYPDNEYEGANLHLMLAAAGNGRKEERTHPSAYFPACDPLVVGVGALGIPNTKANLPAPEDESIARYSNIADAPPDTGYYVFGGGANWQPPDPAVGDPDPQSPDTDRGEGIVGIYIGELPGNGLTKLGLAEWAGTSFATPILSGIVAAILRRCHMRPLDVIKQLTPPPVPKTEEEVPYVPGVTGGASRGTGVSTVDPTAPSVDLKVIQIKQDR